MMIELKNIEKRFGDHTVLKDVSVSVAEGAVMALVGPSGGGKSTLAALHQPAGNPYVWIGGDCR